MSMPAPGGAEAVIHRWHERHGAALLHWARRRCPDAPDDLVQETFLRAWRHLDRYDPARGGERAWLFAIAKNAANDRDRRERRRPLHLVRDADRPPDPSTDGGLGSVDDRALLGVALAELGDAQRRVVIEACVHGRSTADIAERLGIPPGTVKSRLFYGLRALRSALDDTGYEP